VILLVEDEPAVREMVEQVLADHGYAVLVAETPSAAIAPSDRRQGPIDLLVTDVVMPEMSGRELCETLAALSDLRCGPWSLDAFYTAHTTRHPGIRRYGRGATGDRAS
jgi:CheY-like chemotaxis protein